MISTQQEPRVRAEVAGTGKLRFVVAACLFGAFALLATAVACGATRRFDDAVLLAIHGSTLVFLTGAMRVVTFMGSPGLVALTALIAVVLWVRRRRYLALVLALDLGIMSGINTVLKYAFHRSRPDLFAWLTPAFGYSFPSGHTSSSTAVYGLLAVIAVRNGNRAAAGFLGLWVLLIGFSRMYLGVHFPSDVAGSLLLASAWLIVLVTLSDRLSDRVGRYL